MTNSLGLDPIARFLEAPPRAGMSTDARRKRAEEIAHRAEHAARSLKASGETLILRLSREQGFSPFEAQRALKCALEPLRANTLMGIWDRDLGEAIQTDVEFAWPGLSVVIGGGAIPQPNVQAVVAAGMVSDRVLFRPSSGDPVLAPALIEELRCNAPNGGPEFLVTSWPTDDERTTKNILERADSFVCFGEDRTSEELVRYLRPDAKTFVYGTRISFGVLDVKSMAELGEIDEVLKAFAEDIAAYDQRGCLSPAALFVIGADAKACEQIAMKLATTLESRGSRLGFTGRLPPSAAAAIQSLRAVYSMDPGAGRNLLASARLPGWTLLIDATDRTLRPTPGYETLRLIPLANWDELIEAVQMFAGKLQGIGVAPGGASVPERVRARLIEMGISRECALGEMQNPPLDWVHDENPFFPVRVG